jgi:hypothetical protein
VRPRSSEEQQHFLERERFGERRGLLADTIPRSGWVRAGFGLSFVGIALVVAPALARIGRDDGGPFFLIGAMASVACGIGCFLVAVLRRLFRG